MYGVGEAQAGLEQVQLLGLYDGLRPIADVKFAVDITGMDLDRRRRYDQLVSNLSI